MAVQLQPAFTTRARFRADLRDSIEAAIRLGSMKLGDIVDDPETFSTAGMPEVALPDAIANIPVVPLSHLEAAVHEALSGPLPPPSERQAEIRTNAVLNVWARCPNCGIHLVIPVEVEPQLTIGSGGTGELKVKAKSKGRIHACHQLTLDEPEGQLKAFAPDSMGDDVEDVSEDAADDIYPAELVQDRLLSLAEGRFAMPPIQLIELWPADVRRDVHEWALETMLEDAGEDITARPMPAVLGTALADDRIGELRCQGSNHVPGHTEGCPKYEAPAD